MAVQIETQPVTRSADGPAGGFTGLWEQWQRDGEERLSDPHGFLSITSLHWLTAEPQRFVDAPGEWVSDERGVFVRLDAAESLVVEGEAVLGEHCFGVLAERSGLNAVAGNAVIEIAKRGGHDIIRPRHPENPLRLQFAGTPAYTPDPRWVIAGRFVPFDSPRPTTVGAAVEGLQHVYQAPGRVEFVVDGQALSLTVFEGRGPGALTALFTDETSGITTYAANRALHIEPPDAAGRVVLDFNRAANLPCAYTPLATCPLPPAENRLPVAVEAGHKIPV